MEYLELFGSKGYFWLLEKINVSGLQSTRPRGGRRRTRRAAAADTEFSAQFPGWGPQGGSSVRSAAHPRLSCRVTTFFPAEGGSERALIGPQKSWVQVPLGATGPECNAKGTIAAAESTWFGGAGPQGGRGL